jgi:membrane protease YdiL (CAAX protease family)
VSADQVSSPPAWPAARARRLSIELALIFGLGPLLLALGPRWLVSLGILGAGIVASVVLIADPTFDRRQLVSGFGERAHVRRVLARTAGVWALLLVAAAMFAPSLFPLPRTRPLVWALIMVLYPISAWAQEIAYRTFFFHRYGALFQRPGARIAASGLLFGWGHIAVNNLLAVVLASAAGLLFAWTYERSRSTLLVTLEHALYGDFVFSVGLGRLFYSTARWLAATSLIH